MSILLSHFFFKRKQLNYHQKAYMCAPFSMEIHTYTHTHTTFNGAQKTQMRTCAHQDLD